LRKTLIAAGVAALSLSLTGVAHAQDPSITATVKVSPSKSGTSKKPKNETFELSVKNDPASKTTASSIKVTLPKTLKLSTKGFKQCTASDNELISSGGNACKGSKAGPDGSANATIITNGAGVPFKVTPFIGKNELLFFLQATTVSNKYVVHGKIKGRTMTITIGPNLQQPLGQGAGLYAALVDIKTKLTAKKGKNYLFSSTGCKSKKHTVNVTVGYADNPNPPAKRSASTTADAKCS
jgi:hypothetical protein